MILHNEEATHRRAHESRDQQQLVREEREAAIMDQKLHHAIGSREGEERYTHIRTAVTLT
jgi:hypothetical protein